MADNAQMTGGRPASRWSVAVWGMAALLLLLPLAAMQFTNDVNWSPIDFVTFGAMLLVACGTFELAARRARNGLYRAAVGVAVAAGFLLVWVNLAVGFLGDEHNPANLMFVGVLAVAFVGAIAARFQAAAMAGIMVATAATQLLVGAIGLAAGLASPGNEGLYEVVMGSSLFGALWLLSAWLFRTAAGGQASVTAAR
jgi:hypothetical protein